MSYHMYADDTQLYDSATLDQITPLIDKIQMCISAVNCWMMANKLKLNKDKTEVIPCSTAPKLRLLNVASMCIDGDTVPLSGKVKNLGVYLDRDLSMEAQVNHLCKISYLEMRRISQMRSYLDIDSTKTLVSAYILSRIDYCNSLLAGLPNVKINKLQYVQNNAARLVLKRPKREHVIPMLRELHWLPVQARIEYKLAVLCFKAQTNVAPCYIKDLLIPLSPTTTVTLRSAEDNLLTTPRTNLRTYGDRAFTFKGPDVWNTLSQELRDMTNFDTFKIKLKTFLFQKYL